MAVDQELWIKTINENIFTSLDLIKVASTDDGNYLNAKTVHVPQAGAAGTVLKNPARPLVIDQRSDVVLSYDIDEWVMPAKLVTLGEQNSLTYNKLQSIVADHIGGIGERIMREFLINWYPGNTYSVDTTGSNYVAHAPGATGNRKGLVLANLLLAAKKLDDQGYPMNDRYLMVDSTMLFQLLDVLGITTYRDSVLLNASTMDLPPVAGFKIISLPHVAYAVVSTDVVRPYGDAGGTTDQAIAIAAHKSALSFAVGNTEVFNNDRDAIYAGDIVSAAAMAGAKYRRYDKKGVVPIIQAT